MSDGLLPGVATVLDLVLEFLAEGFDVGGSGWSEVGFFDSLGQFFVARLEGAGFVTEIADAGAKHVFGDGAGLEGVHVTVDGDFGLLQLGFGGGQFVAMELRGVSSGTASGHDGSGEQVGVGVDGEEGGEDGLFEDVGSDAFAGAGVFAVSLARPSTASGPKPEIRMGGGSSGSE